MREDGGVWRHELKFVCTMPQLKIIENRIMPLLAPDPHTGPEGAIRSAAFILTISGTPVFMKMRTGRIRGKILPHPYLQRKR